MNTVPLLSTYFLQEIWSIPIFRHRELLDQFPVCCLQQSINIQCLQLNHLSGSPLAARSVSCNHNNNTSLEGAPCIVTGGFHFGGDTITSLKGGPVYVQNSYIQYLPTRSILSLEGLPLYIGGCLQLYLLHTDPIFTQQLEYRKGTREYLLTHYGTYVGGEITIIPDKNFI